MNRKDFILSKIEPFGSSVMVAQRLVAPCDCPPVHSLSLVEKIAKGESDIAAGRGVSFTIEQLEAMANERA